LPPWSFSDGDRRSGQRRRTPTDFYARKFGGRRTGSCTELLRAGLTLTVDDTYRGRQDELVFYAFDLLYLNGFDLRGVRQIERKSVLENHLKGIEAAIVYSEHLVGDGQEMFEHAVQAELGRHHLQERRRAVPI
jgi:hypothetical protein